MKKSLLTITLLLTGIVSYAQVIFNVQSPASISGNYDLTYSDPTGGWGSPDLTVPTNGVTGDLVFVEDGTPGTNPQGNPVSREGCNPLTNSVANGNDLTGKIAVVYRNTCEFGTKAFNAQTAGAIAVIIINREDALISMGPGADGANVTIPVAFISSVSGLTITDMMNAGQTVTAFLGSKVGLYVNDLGLEKTKLLIPNVNTKPSGLAQAQSENIQKFGAKIFNYGNGDQSNVSLKGEVTFGGNVVYSETVSGATTLLSGDSVLVHLPDFQLSSYDIGQYNLTYSVLSDSIDEYASDNTFSIDFFISNGIFSYGQLDANDSIIAPQGYRSSDVTATFQSCIHFQDPNASRRPFKGVYFAASVNDPSTLTGQEFTIHINEWADVFSDVNSVDFTALTEYALTEIATETYTFTAEIEGKSVYVPLSTELTLTDNMRYLVCVETFDANTFIGYTDLEYSYNFDTLNQPISPIITDAGIAIFGFTGSPAASIGMKFAPYCSSTVTFAQSTIEVCQDQQAITLTNPTVNPTGGVGEFVGSGVSGSNNEYILNPSTLAIGANNLTYNYTVDGCTNEATLTVNVNNCASIDEINGTDVVIYPNPANDELVVKTNDFSSVILKDQLGRNVGTWNLTNNVTKLDVSNLSTGNYFLILSGTNGNAVQKVMIK